MEAVEKETWQCLYQITEYVMSKKRLKNSRTVTIFYSKLHQ